MKNRSSLSFLLALWCAVSGAQADVKLPAIISNRMVLEKAERVPIWGKADPGEDVEVSLAGQTVKTQAGADGKWSVALDLKAVGPGPFEMTVQGKNKLTLADVAVGEVWVASGQSNMEWVVKNTIGAEAETAGSTNPLLRHFLVKKAAVPANADDTEGAWVSASPETTGGFTAVGYYFGKKLQSELKSPVGIINTSWGGTPSEAWTSAEALETVPELKAASERLWAEAASYPAAKEEYLKKMKAWLKETAREDKPVSDVAAFAGADISTDGWTKVKIPGLVEAPGLPKTGAVWLRKEITMPAAADLALNLPIDGFDSIYWNGGLLAQTTYQSPGGPNGVRRGGPLNIPAAKVLTGKNVLAIRLYAPAGPAKISGEPKAGPMSLSGEWLAKAEHEFPALDQKAAAAAPQAPKAPMAPQNTSAFLFNGMISPILPYAISGAIWYQGESNAGRAVQYRTAFPLMIADWRKQWGQGEFPFYFCQLANFMPKTQEPGDSAWAELREAQSLTLNAPKTGQAVLIDIGEAGDIHPRNKKDVGERLARIALAKDYGQSVPCSGPVYESMKVENGKARLTFSSATGGLVAAPLAANYVVKSLTNETAPLVRNSPSSQLEGFAICGEDKVWVWADATIDGDDVIVWSDRVPSPVAVRYAWSNNPTCNLANGAGLPASPFRTDSFPATTEGKSY